MNSKKKIVTLAGVSLVATAGVVASTNEVKADTTSDNAQAACEAFFLGGLQRCDVISYYIKTEVPNFEVRYLKASKPLNAALQFPFNGSILRFGAAEPYCILFL